MWYVRHVADFGKHWGELEAVLKDEEDARNSGASAHATVSEEHPDGGSGQEEEDDDQQGNHDLVFGLFSTTEYQ